MPLGINDKDRIEKDRIGSDRRSFFRMVKGSDRIADPFLTKGSGSDRRSRKKGSSNSLTTYLCRYLPSVLLTQSPKNAVD